MSSSTKILVVDDEPIGRQLLEAILIPEGYQLFFGADGEEALHLAQNETPDIILLDVMMPKKDGFEVCRLLKENDVTAHIPVYLITALDDRDSRIRGIDAGAYDYISKPFDRVEILAKIKNITHQLKIIKKGISNKKTDITDNVFHDKIYSVLPVLLEVLLETDAKPENRWIYQSLKASESAHACVQRSSPLGHYTALVSNNMHGFDAALLNSIFRSILFNEVEKNDGQPEKIVRSSLLKLNDLPKSIGVSDNNFSGFSILLVFQNSHTHEIVLSGLNQHAFVLEHKPATDQNQQPEYQLYSLKEYKEQKTEEIMNLVAFSPEVYDKINPQDIVLKLNEMAGNTDNKNPIEQLRKNELSSVNDLLVIKLTF